MKRAPEDHFEYMRWSFSEYGTGHFAKWDHFFGTVGTSCPRAAEIIEQLVRDETPVQCAAVGLFLPASLEDDLRAWGTIYTAVLEVADRGSIHAPPFLLTGEDPEEDFVPTRAPFVDLLRAANLESPESSRKCTDEEGS